MNDRLQPGLLDDLKKSGFYSEMMAIRACTSAKWECRGSFTYFDKDERATRECDFEAMRTWLISHANGDTFQVVAQLLGQVKKSEKPWITFVDRRVPEEYFDEKPEITIQPADIPNWRLLMEVLGRHSLITQNGWISSGIHEAFKKPSDTSKWYSAFVTACKAAESAFDIATSRSGAVLHFQLIKPVVVLDGILVAAELSAEGKLLVTETDSAAFAFEYRSDAYERPHYCLDVVTLEAFPRYLDLIAKRAVEVVEALTRML